MDTHETHSSFRHPTLTQWLVTLTAAVVLAFGFAAHSAQSTQEDQERRFEDRIPKHVPLKVKLKNERAFKDTKNKDWARGLEIEVKNTGTKPIYFMYMVFVLSDFVLEDGRPLAFTVMYGRHELADLEAPLEPKDLPVKPGESITLKISDEQWQGYESVRGNKNKSDPKRVRFDMQMINFGDGTGFESSAGVFLKAPPKRSSRERPPAEASAGCPPARSVSPPRFLRASYLSEPASLLRVDFFEPVSVPPAARACNCQNIPNCFYGKLQCANHCPCTNNCQFLAHISTGNCSDPSGRCRQVEQLNRPCDSASGPQICSFDISLNPCADTDPTPTPTPTPTPPPA